MINERLGRKGPNIKLSCSQNWMEITEVSRDPFY